jgi:hypothetical protein
LRAVADGLTTCSVTSNRPPGLSIPYSSPTVRSISGTEHSTRTHRPKYHIVPTGVAADELVPALRATGTGVVDAYDTDGLSIPYSSPTVRSISGTEHSTRTHRIVSKMPARGLLRLLARYHIVPTGVAADELVPALRATGTGVVDAYDTDPRAGIFDTILCVRVLCSVPECGDQFIGCYACWHDVVLG